MVLEKKHSKENIYIKEILKTDKNQVKEKFNSKMVTIIKAIFRTMSFMVSENTFGKMVRFMKATGLMHRCMVKANILFLTEPNLKDSITWEKDMEKVSSISVISNFTNRIGFLG
jgi:hypothetical protein